jgi:CAAX prenyl protease-like protein
MTTFEKTSDATRKQDPSAPRGEAPFSEMLPYIAPMLVFLLMTSLEGSLPTAWYPAVYALKVAIVAAVAWLCRGTWADLRPVPPASTLLLAAMTGVIVFVLWVRLEGWYPTFGLLGSRTGFDPSALPPPWRGPFVAVRLFGLAMLVPLVEELFWRSFLMRWLIDPDFVRVPVGRVTLQAAAITSAVFALSHPEWLPALLTGLLWAWLLWQTRSLGACVLSHAVANLALGVHVLVTSDWKFW